VLFSLSSSLAVSSSSSFWCVNAEKFSGGNTFTTSIPVGAYASNMIFGLAEKPKESARRSVPEDNSDEKCLLVVVVVMAKEVPVGGGAVVNV